VRTLLLGSVVVAVLLLFSPCPDGSKPTLAPRSILTREQERWNDAQNAKVMAWHRREQLRWRTKDAETTTRPSMDLPQTQPS
jgi:hypothetical protein